MSEFQLIIDYKNNENYRLSFNELANKTFGIDFEKWYQRGCWTNRYICYSFLHNDKIISNVSISLMDIILNQQVYAAIQIGTVMTDPEYRNKGLTRRLMEIVLEEHKNKCSLMYLFANTSVLDFYPKFGFKKVIEPTNTLDLIITNKSLLKTRKLNVHREDDWKKLMELYSTRIPISKKCGVIHSEGIFSWYCLNVFYNDIYLVEELDTILIFQQEDTHLHLYDVVTIKEIKLNELLEILPVVDINQVVFHFEVDDSEKRINKNYFEQEDVLFVQTFEPLNDEILLGMKLPKITQA